MVRSARANTLRNVDALIHFVNTIRPKDLALHGPGIEEDLNRCLKHELAERPSLDERDELVRDRIED